MWYQKLSWKNIVALKKSCHIPCPPSNFGKKLHKETIFHTEKLKNFNKGFWDLSNNDQGDCSQYAPVRREAPRKMLLRWLKKHEGFSPTSSPFPTSPASVYKFFSLGWGRGGTNPVDASGFKTASGMISLILKVVFDFETDFEWLCQTPKLKPVNKKHIIIETIKFDHYYWPFPLSLKVIPVCFPNIFLF